MLNGWHFLNAEELARIERGIVENAVYGGPWHIELQPTNHCNLNCFFCISRCGRRGEVLDWAVLKQLLTEQRRRDLRLLRLSGGGEPLAYPRIRELIELCGEQAILLENITTNGTLLAPLAAALAQTGLDWINVSLNEADPARYTQMMGTGEREYHAALEGIRALAAARNAAPGKRTRIWLQLILWQGNCTRIIEAYEFARSLNVDTIYFRALLGELNGRRLGEQDRAGVEAQLREIIRRDAERAEYKLHFNLDPELDLVRFTRREQARHAPPISENFPAWRRAWPRTEYCFVGWFNTAINARGEVFPCFQYHNVPLRSLGNLYREGLGQIWRGPGYQAFRAQIRELMRLRGRMEPSDQYNRYIERKCTQCLRCQYTYNLATPEFYEQVTQKIQPRETLPTLLRAQARNAGLKLAHRLLQRPR